MTREEIKAVLKYGPPQYQIGHVFTLKRKDGKNQIWQILDRDYDRPGMIHGPGWHYRVRLCNQPEEQGPLWIHENLLKEDYDATTD